MTETRRFVPVHIDQFQAAEYTLVAYTWHPQHGLLARFKDGRAVHSMYQTVEALLAAGTIDWRERVREVR